jgi:hypothetical protein
MPRNQGVAGGGEVDYFSKGELRWRNIGNRNREDKSGTYQWRTADQDRHCDRLIGRTKQNLSACRNGIMDRDAQYDVLWGNARLIYNGLSIEVSQELGLLLT